MGKCIFIRKLTRLMTLPFSLKELASYHCSGTSGHHATQDYNYVVTVFFIVTIKKDGFACRWISSSYNMKLSTELSIELH